MAGVEAPDVFEPVLSWFSWWDHPLSGVAVVDGSPHWFECDFSEELDDYSPEFSVCSIGERTLDIALGQWSRWTAWKARWSAAAKEGSTIEPYRSEVKVGPSLDERAESHPLVPVWRIRREPDAPDGRIVTARWSAPN